MPRPSELDSLGRWWVVETIRMTSVFAAGVLVGLESLRVILMLVVLSIALSFVQDYLI